jgi:hypothetical protein
VTPRSVVLVVAILAVTGCRSRDSSPATDSAAPILQAIAGTDTVGTTLDAKEPANAKDSARVADATAVARERMAAHLKGPGGFGRAELRANMDWYSPRLFTLMLLDMSDPNGVGYLNSDPFTQSQDTPGDVQLDKATLAGDTVRVRFSFHRSGWPPSFVVLAMAESRIRWRIADFLMPAADRGVSSVAKGLAAEKGGPQFSNATVLSLIEIDGPNEVARHMDYDDFVGEQVVNGIASGDSVWLEVAARLDSLSVVDVAESLPISVAEALPKAPARVLMLLATKEFDAGMVCNMPFIEPDSSFLRTYYKDTMTALTGITREDLVAERDRCLKILQSAHKGDAESH